MKNYLSIAFIASSLILSMSSCIKKDNLSDPKLPIWKPDVAVPLVNSDLTLADLIKDKQDGKTTLSTDPDGLYAITYRDTTYSDYAENVIVIPDQSMVVPPFI